jgi:hypothetical protein
MYFKGESERGNILERVVGMAQNDTTRNARPGGCGFSVSTHSLGILFNISYVLVMVQIVC